MQDNKRSNSYSIDILYEAYVKFTTDELVEVLSNCGGHKAAEELAREEYRIETRDEFERHVRALSSVEFQEYASTLMAGYEATVSAGASEADQRASPYLESLLTSKLTTSARRRKLRPGDGSSSPNR